MAQKIQRIQKKKKKKKSHVAIPFLLTLILGIVVLGGIAMYVFKHIGINQEHTVEWNSTVVKPTADDNMTILFILKEEESSKEPLTFMIARILPADKHILFISFPANMLAVVDGRQDSLKGFFNSGGIISVEKALESEAGIHIDRYSILQSEGFQQICDIYGGVYYRVPQGIKGFEDTDAPQFLGARQIEKLMTYPFFKQGESERCATAADLMTTMINVTDSDKERLLASMDTNFKQLINKMETDITAKDFNEHKSALRYMFTYGKNVGMFRLVTGEPGKESDVYLLSSDFYRTVEEYFEKPAEVVTVASEEQDGE